MQAIRDKPTSLKLLRAGKPITIPITAAQRSVESTPTQVALRLWLARDVSRRSTDLVTQERWDVRNRELQALERLEAVEKELKALRKALEKLSEGLKAGKPTERN